MEETKTTLEETQTTADKSPRDRFEWIMPVLCLLGGIGITAGMAASGYELGLLMSSVARRALAVVALVLLAALPILMIVNLLAARAYRREKTSSVKQMQEYYLSRREEACRDLASAGRQVKRLRRLLLGKMLALMYTGLYLPFALGAWLAEKGTLAWWYFALLLIPMYLLYAGFSRIPQQEFNRIDFSAYTKPEDYPTLHALAQKAARSLGLKGKIRIRLLSDCNAGIARVGGTYSLQLGVVLLDLLEEDELYAVLLHEFSHLLGENTSTPEYFVFWQLTECKRAPLVGLHGLLLLYTEVQYVFEYFLYRVASSIAIETLADRSMAEYGDAQTAANALAKLAYQDLFEHEFNLHVHEHFYEPEELRHDSIGPQTEAFRRAYATRADFWRELLTKEIEPRNASHPILRNRLKTLGVDAFSTSFPQDEGTPYRAECQKATCAVNEELYTLRLPDYTEERKRYYLESMGRLEAWSMSSETLTAEEARPVMDAMWSLARYDELEKLCDRLIGETENQYATAHAEMLKGRLMLLRYDSEGVDHIRRAIEINHNYIDDGLEEIGSFYCLMGLQEELDSYRAYAMELYQKQQDLYSQTGELNKNDDLRPENLPQGMLEEILQYAREIDTSGTLLRIYLVRKVIAEDFFTSAFVLEFDPNADGDASNEVYDKIFNHLDTHPVDWQFSLFVYDEQLASVLKRVKNCCVFERGGA